MSYRALTQSTATIINPTLPPPNQQYQNPVMGCGGSVKRSEPAPKEETIVVSCNCDKDKRKLESVGTISVDTSDRIDTSTFNPCRITIGDQLPGFDKLSLLSASIPVNWDIINSTNNQLTIEEQVPNNIFTVTIAPGNYTASGLAAQLQATLNASSPGAFTYTVGYNNITNKITISCTNTYRIRGDLNTTTSIAPLIGFTLSATTYAITQTSTYKVDIGPPRQIFIRVKSVGGNLYTSNETNRGNTFVVPLNAGAYQVSLYEALNAFEQSTDVTPGASRALRNMEISLHFNNGNIIPIESNWSIVMGMSAMK